MRHALADIIADDKRASEVIQRLRAFLRKRDLERSLLDLNQLIGETITLAEGSLAKKDISIRLKLLPTSLL
ncbi:hypothetical protein [Nitrosococcus watsonii]|uniref:hypothetical protein n=1 Tax=Nitrosococcus watsonii TaxID=473531 RepID=UPI000305745F|nr:hypothetical protein [Nitrosococcus watsonii]